MSKDTCMNEIECCPEKIRQQVEKIISNQFFSHSDILKRFLLFIVQEKIAGRANRLKEYTIGLDILKKPKTFKPQENGIVRIHAGRLRRALDLYYSGAGMMDEIRIILPKGHYEPFFIQHTNAKFHPVLHGLKQDDREVLSHPDSVSVAVIPFCHVNENVILNKLSEGLGIQLTTALAGLKSVKVTSFHVASLISGKLSGIHETSEVLEVQYIFSGHLQAEKNIARITVELFKSDNSELVWSKMYEKKISEETLFKVQDELIGQILRELQKPGNLLKGNRKKDTMMAVA